MRTAASSSGSSTSWPSPELREWGLRMVVVARTIERIGDRAVDIGEQTAYLLTAEFREFTDASHPVDGLRPLGS